MRGAMAMVADPAFDLPPHFAVVERRMAGQALDRWQARGRGLITGFEANSLVIADPFGAATIDSVGDAIAGTFGLAAGLALGTTGLAAELRAACGLMAIDIAPQPFEATLEIDPDGCIVLRGIALPICDHVAGAIGDNIPDFVQFVVNWREVLNRSASARLRRELVTALRIVRAVSPKIDPFAPDPRE
ncbi:hypothetical protein GCM10011529_30220 [Polymorphobacter glacialis]|uniref:Uncharacterized protein n=1 Tax=Sandarakinorhabdus glacialis TaxID=1614636 RepID=A0A917EDF9_9SPHN|nr:hypothetical protein [Polymorphobacter glacialis]GGE21532.1 hypothetical protein GCM10011529_30220 [Polymorphobacter glacialis]